MKYRPSVANKYSQQGATLIIVLLVLVLIILAGAIVVSKSNTDLRLATASQIDSLLFISAEQPNANLEHAAEDPNQKIFSETDGMLGYFIGEVNEGNANHKIVTCYRPKLEKPFAYDILALYSSRDGSGRLDRVGKSKKVMNEPFCNVEDSKYYTSDRNATVSQIAVTRGSTVASKGDFSDAAEGIDLSGGESKSYSLNVESTSALPAYGSATDSKVNNCFLDSSTPPEACLQSEGVPNKTVSQNYLARFQDKIEEAS